VWRVPLRRHGSRFGLFTISQWKGIHHKDEETPYWLHDHVFVFNSMSALSMVDVDHVVCVVSKSPRFAYTYTREVALFRLDHSTKTAWYARTLFPYEDTAPLSSDNQLALELVASAQVVLMNFKLRTVAIYSLDTGELRHTVYLPFEPIGMEWRVGFLLVFAADGSNGFTVAVYA
jgi:hypothetical protein